MLSITEIRRDNINGKWIIGFVDYAKKYVESVGNSWLQAYFPVAQDDPLRKRRLLNGEGFLHDIGLMADGEPSEPGEYHQCEREEGTHPFPVREKWARFLGGMVFGGSDSRPFSGA